MNNEKTLWMGDIEPWMTEPIIVKIFKYFNINPINVKIIKDKNKNANKNYGFITFKNIHDARNALNNLNTKKIPSTNIFFKLNWAEHQSVSVKTIYVGNINVKVGDNELYKLFSQKYKSLYHANIIKENGISKGYGFVSFRNEEDYFKCLKEMNGFYFYGNNIRVREKRKKDDENNNSNNNNIINGGLFENKNKEKNKKHIYNNNN